MRRALAVVILLLLAASPSAASDAGLYRFDPRGRVKGVRAADLTGDGRLDLVVLVERTTADGTAETDVVVLKAPATPDARAWFVAADAVRIPCDGPAAGARATAGALAVGRFGATGPARLRFLGADGAFDLDADGKPLDGVPPEATLVARSPGAPLVFWEGVGDLDGDGRDECWLPDAAGRLFVAGLPHAVKNEARQSPTELVLRKVSVPTLLAADVDGDGRKELLHLEGSTLVIERVGASVGATPASAQRVALPFLVPDPARPPEEIRSPRLSVADVDGDRRADLLVTLVQGRADKVGGLRTAFYYFPGPFVGPDGALVQPKARLDTESVALHPRFVDVDGDGRLDYVADSIRGNTLDLIQRVMGKEPDITFTIFRYDPAAGTFERTPYVTKKLPYSGGEARGNTFGRSGWLDGDFDGDGVKDLLDLGNLTGVAIWKGGRGEDAFEEALLKRVAVDKDKALVADAVVADLNADGRADAVLFTEDALYLIVSKGAK